MSEFCLFFIFTPFLLLLLRYSYHAKAAGACIAKYLSSCLSVRLSFRPSVHLCDCPACLSDCLLCHFSSLHSVILLVDFCHMCLKQSLHSSGLCCLSPPAPEFVSWLVCVYVCVLTCVCAWSFTCGLRLCVSACLCVNLCVCVRLQRAHLSVKRLSAGY